MLTEEKWLQFEFAAPVELDLIRQWLALSVGCLSDRYTLKTGQEDITERSVLSGPDQLAAGQNVENLAN